MWSSYLNLTSIKVLSSSGISQLIYKQGLKNGKVRLIIVRWRLIRS